MRIFGKKKYMNTFLSILCATSIILISCDTKTAVDQTATQESSAKDNSVQKEPHRYGGWFCPDNLGGFPPVDIQNLDIVPVVTDRLPTEDETRDGRSLIHVDTAKYPDAKALRMDLPRVARIKSSHNGLDELIIVIQAIVVQDDTVVGYRFPHGGNGSAWYSDVTFLSDTEKNALGSRPFVYLDSELSGNKASTWAALAQTDYADKLSKWFDQREFLDSKWTPESRAYLNFESDTVNARGYISDMYGILYIHVDYDYNGNQYSEKVVVSENLEEGTAHVTISMGPYPDNLENRKAYWNKWLEKLRNLSKAG